MGQLQAIRQRPAFVEAVEETRREGVAGTIGADDLGGGHLAGRPADHVAGAGQDEATGWGLRRAVCLVMQG